MKRSKFNTLLLLVLLLSAPSVLASEDHTHDDHADEHEVPDHCENATAELLIKAQDSANAFTQEEYQVEKNTCYEMKFQNPSMVTDHDVNIDAVDNGDIHFEKVHIHVANASDGENGVKSMHVLTPDTDTELTIYCSVEGHENMKATLIVGEGNSALPYSGVYAIVGILFAAVMAPIIRKR